MCMKFVLTLCTFFLNCHLRTWQLFFIATSGPGNFLKLPPTDLAIFLNCHLRTWQLFFIGGSAGGALRRRFRRISGFFRQNCRKPIRQLFFIATSGSGNFLKLPLTDPAIFLNCHIRMRELFFIGGSGAGDFWELSTTPMTINNIPDDKYRIIKARGGINGRITVNLAKIRKVHS